MNSDSGGIPPDIGLTSVALAITSSMDVIEDNSVNSIVEHSQFSVNETQVQGQAPQEEQAESTDKNEKQKRTPYKYDKDDSGPFHVYIEHVDKNFTGRLNAMKVGELILLSHPELDKKISNIETIGKNRILVILKNADSANSLSGSTSLKKRSLDSYIPKFILFRQGVIRGVDVSFSEEYLKDKIKAHDHDIPVDKVTRIFRKTVSNGHTEYVPTQSIIVSFKTQKLPKYVTINRVIASVEPYIQKVILCFNCFRYGHLGKQ